MMFTVYLFNPVSPSVIAVINMKNLFSLLAIKRLSDTKEEEKERGSDNHISQTAWLLFFGENKEDGVSHVCLCV